MDKVSIEIPTELLLRLLDRRESILDDFGDVIARGLDAQDKVGGMEDRLTQLEARLAQYERPDRVDVPTDPWLVDPADLPPLAHAVLVSAIIEGQHLENLHWNPLLGEMIARTLRRMDFDQAELLLSPVKMLRGRTFEQSYAYLDEINTSVQRQTSDAIARAVVRIAREIGLSVDLTFRWPDRSGVTHRGEIARLMVQPRRYRHHRRAETVSEAYATV